MSNIHAAAAHAAIDVAHSALDARDATHLKTTAILMSLKSYSKLVDTAMTRISEDKLSQDQVLVAIQRDMQAFGDDNPTKAVNLPALVSGRSVADLNKLADSFASLLGMLRKH